MVTVYNQDTFDIGKIRVNRVITVRQLLAKIADYFELEGPDDIAVRIGELELSCGSTAGNENLEMRLYQDLNFDESNLINVKILSGQKHALIQRKQERLAD